MAAAEYRWANTTISAATLNGSSSYLLENFPLQSDQLSIYINPWGPPGDEGTTYPKFASYFLNADSSQGHNGFVTFDWVLKYLTEGMVYYIENTVFGGADFVLSTVKTLTRNGSFQVYQCTALLPVLDGEHFKRGDRGVEDYKIRFVAGVQL